MNIIGSILLLTAGIGSGIAIATIIADRRKKREEPEKKTEEEKRIEEEKERRAEQWENLMNYKGMRV